MEEKLDNSKISEEENLEQYLTFLMAEEEYGVDILSVQEIRGWESVTPVPNSPKHVKGVINLRGTIVPIIDLRAKFNLDAIDYGPLTVVIVLKVALGTVERVMGIVVDAVSDVYGLSLEDMQTAPDLGDHINTNYIQGLAGVDEKMIVVLDIDALLANDMRSQAANVSVH
ncbi:chemotaxis protein CheW [Gammaproteobacteria bacterium 45_16_T64]|nr:chemotaxis protein CheW [Gammaproteobacteria bacterium 45_16_T64]